MLTDIQKRRCIRCGREFTYFLGGFILRDPICPRCAQKQILIKKP